MSSFTELNLSAEILQALNEAGYTSPTPIQEQAIPVVLNNQDLMAGAQTGTGKTAAFSLPLLQKLLPHANTSTSPARHPIRALILVPTRELAVQVEESIKSYGQHTKLRSLVVYGGVDIKNQTPELKRGVEILVATPGRLLDHIEMKTVNLQQVQMLILDEADRMLDMGFLPDLKRILTVVPKQRQTLMFSATFSDEIKKLCAEFLNNPTHIEVARSNATSDNVTQKVYLVEQDRKYDMLVKVLREQNVSQVIVFTKTKLSASQLARKLQRDEIAADAIHGDKSQLERMQALEAFKQGKVTVLIGTDVAARGLDIDQLPMVINFEIPNTPEDYVHRIGRTGRAGASGIAISLVAPTEEKALKEIEKLIKRQLPKENAAPPTRTPTPSSSTNSKRERKPIDNWFERPYEPSASVAALKEHEALPVSKPKFQIAALLRKRA